jgi:hypothetical protein
VVVIASTLALFSRLGVSTTRLVLTLTVALTWLVSAAAGTAAAATFPVNAQLSGTAVWSAQDALSFVHTFSISGTVDGLGGGGTYSGTLDAGTYSTSASCGPACADVTGTIDFVTRRGSFTATVQPAGLVVWFSIGSGTTYNFTLTLTFVGGTRSFSHATGELGLSYFSHLPSPGSGVCNPFPTCSISDGGTLTGTISRPAAAG